MDANVYKNYEEFLARERHLTRMVLSRADKYGAKTALRHKPYGQWKSYSWQQFAESIRVVARALLAWGVAEHEMVGIFSANRAEWSIADLGIMALRGVCVPVYGTNSTEEADYIIDDARIRIMFVGDQAQFDRTASLLESSNYLKKIVVFDKTVDMSGHAGCMYFSDFLDMGHESGGQKELQARLDQVDTEDTATLIYTSGTTGNPKGVMLSHRNFLAMLSVTGVPLPLGEEHANLCFLPLSHVFERSWTYFIFSRGAENNYVIDTKEIMAYFKEVQPHYMTSVPRVWEKIYAALHDQLESAPALKKKLFAWSLAVGGQYYPLKAKGKAIPLSLKIKHAVAHKLVLAKIQGAVGGRCMSFNVGGAPFNPEINRFFYNAGIMLAQGYGMTELFPICVTTPEHIKFGTCGPQIPLIDIRFSEDGEIQAKGPTAMQGYWNRPEATAEMFTEDGWMKTGDIGIIDDDGYVVITDRAKELIITSGGKNISPLTIETALKEDFYVEQAVAVGDNRKYISALIVPSFPALEAWAKGQGLNWSSWDELLALPQVVDFYKKRVAKQMEPLGQVEKVKKFTLLANELTQEAGELTPTSKLKRKAISKKYDSQINGMYPAE